MRAAPIRSSLAAATLTTLTLAPGLAGAAGFAIIEQSVSGLGNAFAGAAASADDASTIYYNPAGMMRIQGRQVVAGLHAINPSTRFSDEGSSAPGGDGGDAGKLGVVPNFYYLTGINEDVSFGIGVTVPFGLATEYEDGWKGRYQALRSAVESLNINPSLGFRFSPRWSGGFGVNLQYFKADLSNAVDFSSVCLGAEAAGQLPGGTCNAAGLVSPQNPATDGKADISGSSWGFGFNLGVMFEPSESTRVGLAYRSQVKQKLAGRADFTLPAAASAVLPLAMAFADSDVTANVDLPSTLSLSVFHQINPSWAVMADFTRTGWSSYDRMLIEFDNPYKGASVEESQWKDSNRFSVGANFTPNRKWILRAGVAYDATPIPGPELRSARIPGNDRTWLALGMGYRLSDALGFDLGYAHLFVDSTGINRTGATGDLLKGSYENSVDIFSGQLVWSF